MKQDAYKEAVRQQLVRKQESRGVQLKRLADDRVSAHGKHDQPNPDVAPVTSDPGPCYTTQQGRCPVNEDATSMPPAVLSWEPVCNRSEACDGYQDDQ